MDRSKETAGGARRPWGSAPENASETPTSAGPAPQNSPAPAASEREDAPNVLEAKKATPKSAAEAAETNASAPGTPAREPASASGPARRPAYAYPPEQLPPEAPEKKIGFTPLDIGMSLAFFAVGWLFWEWQLWGWSRTPLGVNGTALFTLLYAAAVLGYLFAAGRTPPRESWFWLAVLLGLGLAYALPYGGGLLGALHYGALLLTAVYWTLCAAGRLMKGGRTSNWLAFDLFHALFLLPWGNFLRLFAAPLDGLRRLHARLRAGKRRGDARRLWSVLGGVAAAAVCLFAVLPSLMAADDGFSRLMHTVGGALFHWHISSETVIKLFFAMPTAQFLYGLAYGAVRGRRLGLYDPKEVCAMQRGLRFAPRVTVLTALLALCAIYLLFLSLQAKYLFGAFLGALPEGFTYSGYARQGFFELCRVAAVNLAILLAANLVSREQAGENRLLRLCNTALSVLTLLLLATAASKMALYIAVYGLTVKRVLVSVFLLWLAVVFLAVLLRQLRPVPLVRVAVFTGAALFTLLCALPVEDGINAYNAAFLAEEPAAQTESDFIRADRGAYAAVVWEGREYVPFCPADAGEQGRYLGCMDDGDVPELIYAWERHSEREWILVRLDTGLMDAPMLMRERTVWDFPERISSEYAWNEPDAEHRD